VPSTDGKVYVVDLGRWSIPDEISLLRSDTSRVRTSSVITRVPATGDDELGLGAPADSSADYSIDAATMAARVEVTPGFTRTEQWQVVWQGVLPSLGFRAGVLFQLADGTPALALQEQLGGGWRIVAALADPFLGVGDDLPNGWQDLAVITASAGVDVSRCPLDSSGNAVLPITAVLPPDAVNYPGGAVALSDLRADGAHCLASLPPFDVTAQVRTSQVDATVRAGGLVLTGTVSGYAGRPQLGQRYALAWSEADYDIAPSSARALARKARRQYYPSDPHCPNIPPDTYCSVYPYFTDPLAPGPAIAFRANFLGAGPQVQDAALVIATQSGVTSMFRRPTVSGALPRTGIAFDRGLVGKADQGMRFYVPFADDQLLGFGPGESAGDIVVIR